MMAVTSNTAGFQPSRSDALLASTLDIASSRSKNGIAGRGTFIVGDDDSRNRLANRSPTALPSTGGGLDTGSSTILQYWRCRTDYRATQGAHARAELDRAATGVA
jgi:hypothetical protein